MNTQPKATPSYRPQIEDYQQLAAGIQPGVELLILDKDRDGIEQITEYLTGSCAGGAGAEGRWG
ncbi:DUF4347 domain-containing protein [[Phormidium] sp. ETS-05]|uniref:DUF4347 domain-containing protein n=1 Tax=[Phormidium] sp. ETS-05 TaxID=222819 RepID=UPI0018EF0A4C|nr:DUF4347 domain-containing protein [[Phormidium] sp. ETS-05]